MSSDYPAPPRQWQDRPPHMPAPASPSAVDLSEDDVDRTEHRRDVGKQMAAAEEIHRLQMRKARCADLAAIRLVGAVSHEVDAEFTLRRFHSGVGLTGRHVIAF